MSLSRPQNATLLDDEGRATITANDGTDLPTLAIDDVTVSEDGGSAVFSVTLNKQSDDVVTVTYDTSNGSAIADSDYTATSGTLVFQPGQQAKTIAVAVSDDTLLEGNETFTVSLSDPPNATLLKGVGTASRSWTTTARPSGNPTLAIYDVTVTEGSGSAVFRVGLNKSRPGRVTVVYRRRTDGDCRMPTTRPRMGR